MSDTFWDCLLSWLPTDDQQLMAGFEMVLHHRRGYGSKFNIPVTKRKRRQPAAEASAVERTVPVAAASRKKERAGQGKEEKQTEEPPKKKQRPFTLVQAAYTRQ